MEKEKGEKRRGGKNNFHFFFGARVLQGGMSASWADQTDDNDSAPAPPPSAKPGWGKVAPVQAVGLVFEDFEVKNSISSEYIAAAYPSETAAFLLMLCLQQGPVQSKNDSRGGGDRGNDRGGGGLDRGGCKLFSLALMCVGAGSLTQSV